VDRQLDKSQVRVTAETTANSQESVARIRADEPVEGPVVTLHLRAGCAQKTMRRYVVLAAAKPRQAGAQPDATLGTTQLVVDRLTGWLRGISTAEALRRALRDWLDKDKTFQPDDRDDTFKQVTASINITNLNRIKVSFTSTQLFGATIYADKLLIYIYVPRYISNNNMVPNN
jgi:hypothetical protein